jgi:CheY-like chemotaxis protein
MSHVFLVLKRGVEYCCLQEQFAGIEFQNTCVRQPETLIQPQTVPAGIPEKIILCANDNRKRKIMLEKPKILVVDDNRVIASTLAAILDGQGYETLTAYSGEEAVDVACSFHPKLLLSDISMGLINGVNAAISILSALPHCKVLFISGHASCADVLGNARAQGFNFEVLTKPVPPPELLNRVSQVLRA